MTLVGNQASFFNLDASFDYDGNSRDGKNVSIDHETDSVVTVFGLI